MIRRYWRNAKIMNLKLFIALFAAAALATGTLACDEKKADDKKEEAKKDDKKDDKDEEKDEGDTKEAKDEGGDEDLSDLPQECQDYIKEFEACMEKVSDDAIKGPMETAMKTQRDAFKSANTPEAKEGLKMGCEMSLKAIRDNPACK